jgi:hypothetical protein
MSENRLAHLLQKSGPIRSSPDLVPICGKNLERFALSVKFAYQLIFLSKNPKPTQYVFSFEQTIWAHEELARFLK